MSDAMEAMAERVFRAAVGEGRCAELMEALFEGAVRRPWTPIPASSSSSAATS